MLHVERKEGLSTASLLETLFLSLDEFRPVGVAARQLSREPYFGGRGESYKNGRLRKAYPKTIKTADPRCKGVMGVMEQEIGLTE